MADEVEIQIIPETRVAYMRYVGAYGSPRITELWQRFAIWYVSQGLIPPKRRLFGIARDNPNTTPPDRTRYDACIPVEADFEPQGEIGVQIIPAGRYGCVPFTGCAAEIGAAWTRLVTRTLPAAGLQPVLAPTIEIYAPNFIIDPRTGAFSCT